MKTAQALPARPAARVQKWQSILQAGLLALVFVLGLGVRLIDIQDPPLDWHAVRQLRSALIARSVYYQLTPDADPQIRQMAIGLGSQDVHEPPIAEYIVGLAYKVAGGEQLWMSRVFTSLFWLIGGLALFGMARRLSSFGPALLSVMFYFFLPFSAIASRSFQPDGFMVMWILLTGYAVMRWIETPNWKWALIAGVLGGITILVKAMAGFFIAGIMVGAVLAVFGWKRLWRSPQVWAMAALSLAPALIFYLGAHATRASEYFSFWTLSFSSLLLEPNFYADWLAMVKSLMGLAIFFAAILGTFLAPARLRPVALGLWVGYVLFGLAWPFQYSTHEYYHLMLVPIVSLGIAPLIKPIFDLFSQQNRVWRVAGAAVIVFMSFYFLYITRSQLLANDYRSEPAAWKHVGETLPTDGKIIALTGDFGFRLAYYGWRTVDEEWPATDVLGMQEVHGNAPMDTEQTFQDLAADKAYFVVTSPSALDAQPELRDILTTRYPLISQVEGVLVYDLRHPLSSEQ